MKKALSICILLLSALSVFAQNDKSQRPSPPGQAQCSFTDGKKITIDYSRPSMKDRKIYGGLVPWDKEWRTGANEATTFVTDADLTVGGTRVPAGSYTLYTLPSQHKWALILSKKTGQWGIPYPGKENDFARIPMKTNALGSPVEQFTISFDEKGSACTLNLDWEKTRASIAIKEQK